MTQPLIAVPIGDPAGVGPEIVVKALASDVVKDCANCIIIGDKGIIDKVSPAHRSRSTSAVMFQEQISLTACST